MSAPQMSAPHGWSKMPLARSASRSFRETNKSGFNLGLSQLAGSFRTSKMKNASFRAGSQTERDMQEAIRLSLQEVHEDKRYSSARQRLESRARDFGLSIIEGTDCSGNCQFDSIAYVLNALRSTSPDHKITHRDVRKKVSSWLLNHPDYKLESEWGDAPTLKGFFDLTQKEMLGFDSWADYCQQMGDTERKPVVMWGDHYTLIAAAEVYGHPICVFSSTESPLESNWRIIIKPRRSDMRGSWICLAHMLEEHYMPLWETG